MRKFEAINLMKLYSLGSSNGWNQELTKYYNRMDINGLAKLKYQIQAGMDDLVKAKLNTDEINTWFLRLNKSIEDTAKKIIKKKFPSPIDDPLKAAQFSDMKELKTKRDKELVQFLVKSSY